MDLVRSSPDKVRWLHGLAVARKTKQEADADLRLLGLVHLAFAGTQTKKGATAYGKMRRALSSIVNSVPVEKQDLQQNRRKVVKSLVKLGAALQAKAA